MHALADVIYSRNALLYPACHDRNFHLAKNLKKYDISYFDYIYYIPLRRGP